MDFARVLTAGDVRALVQAACEAGTHNTFYPIWNDVKDRPSSLTYPCCIWLQWSSRMVKDEFAFFHRHQLVRLLVITNTPTDRTPVELQQLVESADMAAAEIVLALHAQDTSEKKDFIENVVITTEFDEGAQMESGVLLQFTVKDPAAMCPA